MSVKIRELKTLMVSAAKRELLDEWPDVKAYAETESKKIAETIKMIGTLTAQGKMSKAAAKLHLRIQRNAARTVLLTVEGMSLLAVEAAINAAIQSIRDVVNDALGFALI